MKQKTISIIIPVYNVEKYLEKCMESVLKQTYSALEIILIDDGSTDGSGELCDRYQKKDCRIKVVHQKNQGLAAARNSGLAIATGDYIIFADSDDYLEESACRTLLDYADSTEGDICFFGHYRVKCGDALPYDVPPEKLEYTGKKEILQDFFSRSLAGKPDNGEGFTGLSACCGFYKAEVIRKNNLRFRSEREILSEDILFNAKACMCVDKIAVCPQYLYYYVQRPQSLTKSYRQDRFAAALRLDAELKRLAQEHDVYRWLDRGIDNCFGMNLIVCLKQEAHMKRHNGYKKMSENMKTIGTSTRTEEYIKNSTDAGIKKRLLFTGLKSHNWLLVYIGVCLWNILEKILRK